MNEGSLSTLRGVAAKLDEAGICYMVVGSMAALAHGHVRSTNDMDVVFEASMGQIRRFVALFDPDEHYVSEDAAIDGVRRGIPFNVIDQRTGWKIDLIPRKDRAFSEAELSRRVGIDTGGAMVYFASIEDCVLSKLEWARLGGGSERQIEDASRLAGLHSGSLDRGWIERWVDDLGIRDLWEKIDSLPEKDG